MRILIASDHYPPAIGGGQLTTWFLATELARRGHDVAVATVWQPGLPDVKLNGVQVHRLRQLRTAHPFLVRGHRTYHQPPFPDPVTVIGLRRLINRFCPDVVHSHGWFSYSCAAALLGKDVPLVLSARDYGYVCANRTLLRGTEACTGPGFAKCIRCAGAYYGQTRGFVTVLGVFGGRHLLRRKASGFHSVSAYVEQRVGRDLFRNRKGAVVQRVIHEIVTADPSAPSRHKVEHYVDRLPSEPFVLYVGSLRRVKGVHDLVAAYARLEAPPPLVLIGTRERDTPASIPRGVVVLHDFPHSAVTAAWKRCLFGVIPSRLPEPFGMVLVEAMSAGKAVITTVPGGHGDVVVDGVTGLLVPPGDPEALARAMRRLLGDPLLRERLAKAAYARASTITPDTSISAFEELYCEAKRMRAAKKVASDSAPRSVRLR